MQGDFSRVTFDPLKNFNRVLMQQGRVLLDADWNEQTDIIMHHLRMLAKSIYGAHGGGDKAGFGITSSANGLKLSAGAYYVDGILCENDRELILGFNAKKSPPTNSNYLQVVTDKQPQTKNTTYHFYLKVWERYVSSAEDENLRETALGEVDTCGRMKVEWEIRATTETIPDTRSSPIGPILDLTLNGAKTDDPCTISPQVAYRSTQNHLYRVEAHITENAQKLKWSRDNASALLRLPEGTNGKKLLVPHIKRITSDRNPKHVEILTQADLKQNQAGTLAKIISISSDDDIVSLDIDVSTPGAKYVRIWDGVINLPDNSTYALENGLNIMINNLALLKQGDYWIFTAREGMTDTPHVKFCPQIYYYAPLADAQLTDAANDSFGNGTEMRKIANFKQTP